MDALRLSDVLPLLETISRQQDAICERLADLNTTLRSEPEPVTPTLRALLRPLREGLWEMRDHLGKLSDSAEELPTSTETGSSAPPTA